jgi:hypothetical protein
METPRKRRQCTQQKLQSICAVLTFDPQPKKILIFSVKDRYQLNYFICIKDFNAETRHISIGVFVVYIDTGSPVLYISSKSRDLADENSKILTEWK